MKKHAFLSRYVKLPLIILLVADLYFAGALPHQKHREGLDKGTFLRFGQSLALADFDGDRLVDNATLSGIGRNKSVDIRLSHSATRTLVHFDTLTSEQGSLFSNDVDTDGDNDLIWTDLINCDDVVIWLDDGAGRFERICSDRYAQEFVLADVPTYGASEKPHQDSAFNSQRNPSTSLSPAPGTQHLSRTTTFYRRWQNFPIADSYLTASFDRGPPLVLQSPGKTVHREFC